MPQLHLYVSDDVAAAMRARAQRAGMPLSRYLAKVVAEAADDAWPEGWLDGIAGASPGFAVPDEPVAPPIEPLDATPRG